MAAVMTMVLAKATGWQEEKIWQMAFARLLQYVHAYVLSEGGNTDWAYANAAEERLLAFKIKNALHGST